MKRVSYSLAGIVIVGATIVSLWVYGKYFRDHETNAIFASVERGTIQDIVKVRGELVAEHEYSLAFPFTGIIERVFVRDGDSVLRGAKVMKLDTKDHELEIVRLEALLSKKLANLAKFEFGTRVEDIRIAETKVANAERAFGDTEKNLFDKLRDAFTKADDAVRNKVDPMFSNPKTRNPQLSFTPSNADLEAEAEWERYILEITFAQWERSIGELALESDLVAFAETTKAYLETVRAFLDTITLALDGITSSDSISQATIDSWRTDVTTARTNVDSVTNGITIAEEKLQTAQSSLNLAERQLELSKAGERKEDIEVARAEVAEVKGLIAIEEEKINKSILRAPSDGMVTKVWLKQGELFTTGETAVTLSTVDAKVEADVSELDIGRVSGTTTEAVISLDAFPGMVFFGDVVSIDPLEIVKDGDTYFRVNVRVATDEIPIRPGMSADLTIVITTKENVLKIPEYAVRTRDGKQYVVVVGEDGRQKDVLVETGISDGEFIEVVHGLIKGQTVMVANG